jgi:outer membrane protein OmpA-like peptidoglycan-associated protein
MLQGTAKNSQELEQIIKHKSGMEGFGGSTSIFDALDLSINSFQADSSYQPVIILFSDGYENSSKKSDIKSIVGNAKMRNIPIFTIAFGEGADGNLLSSIANETNGTFWQTYDRNEFKYIFSNELFLLNQYYEIKFLPCSFDYEKILITGNTKLGNQAYGEKTLLGLKEVISLSINFDFNSSTIDSKYKDDLDKIAVYLARNSNYNINIYGHTDNTGTKEYNQILSLDRAQAIRQALINRGINKTRITAIGKGEDEPYVPNTTEENKYRNRRIEVELIK